MDSFGRLDNVIQEYAWGSTTAIQALLGQEANLGKPQAELWMGAHAKAPSTVIDGANRTLLSDLIQENPCKILGDEVASKFSSRMPYLFKVLAAEKPLSIQAHPSKENAQKGYFRENRAGIPQNAPNRNYRDDQHKPELLCALTTFWALCGFRPFNEIVATLQSYLGRETEFTGKISEFKGLHDSKGIRRLFKWLMTAEPAQREYLVNRVVHHAESGSDADPVCYWIRRLHAEYPFDIGVFAPILLHLIRLEPGQALFLSSGRLHSYLGGVGIELMANSDNVLRGGLTPKHVDTQELFSVLEFAEQELSVLTPQPVRACESAYITPAEEFLLSVIRVHGDNVYRSSKKRGIEILLCTEGVGTIASSERGQPLEFTKGTSIMVPASTPIYAIRGDAIIYKASVPFET